MDETFFTITGPNRLCLHGPLTTDKLPLLEN